MSAHQTETNEPLFKDAARRMVAFYAKHGIKVPYAMSLDALTQAVGDKSFRRFRKLLQQPVEQPIPDAQRWFVTAIYSDNKQPYDQYYAATDALEAAVLCQLDRLSDAGGGEVDVVSVLDRTTDRIADTGFVGDTALVEHGFALRQVVDIAKSFIPMDSTLTDVVARDTLAAHILYLDEFLGEPTYRDGKRIPGAGEGYISLELGWSAEEPQAQCVVLSAYDMDVRFDPVEAVRNVARYVLDTVQVKGWATLDQPNLLYVYQAKGLTTYFECQLRALVVDDGLFSLAEVAETVEDVEEGTRLLTWFDALEQQLEREAGHVADRIVTDCSSTVYRYRTQ